LASESPKLPFAAAAASPAAGGVGRMTGDVIDEVIGAIGNAMCYFPNSSDF
jgi:hypothetical protein